MKHMRLKNLPVWLQSLLEIAIFLALIIITCTYVCGIFEDKNFSEIECK